jgi:hypothetical protein
MVGGVRAGGLLEARRLDRRLDQDLRDPGLAHLVEDIDDRRERGLGVAVDEDAGVIGVLVWNCL